MMNVYFNSESISTNTSTLGDFLDEQNLKEKAGIAIAINSEIISKSNWTALTINENDKILVITATQGG